MTDNDTPIVPFKYKCVLDVKLAVCHIVSFCVMQEQKVIEGIKQQLQQNIHQAFEQLCVLQEARQQVLADLQDKNVALGIDVDQYNLTDESSEISFKPDPTRVMKG